MGNGNELISEMAPTLVLHCTTLLLQCFIILFYEFCRHVTCYNSICKVFETLQAQDNS